jgi:putative DNA methylase
LVCRTTGKTRGRWIFDTPAGLAQVVAADIALLAQAGRIPTVGDTRCIVFGHLTRMAVWRLRHGWEPRRPMTEKLAQFAQAVADLGDVEECLQRLSATKVSEAASPAYIVSNLDLQELSDAVSF